MENRCSCAIAVIKNQLLKPPEYTSSILVWLCSSHLSRCLPEACEVACSPLRHLFSLLPVSISCSSSPLSWLLPHQPSLGQQRCASFEIDGSLERRLPISCTSQNLLVAAIWCTEFKEKLINYIEQFITCRDPTMIPRTKEYASSLHPS